MKPDPVGLLEKVSPFRVSGWALDRANPDLALDLVLRIDGVAVNWFRPNRRVPAIADYLRWPPERLGLVGFMVALPEWVCDGRSHSIDVLVPATGSVLTSRKSEICFTTPHRPLADLPRLPVAAPTPVNAPKASSADWPNPTVSLVVLNRNGHAVLQHLFESWQQHSRSVPVEWLVVDHASTDASLALLADWQQRLNLQVLALDTNDSFAASCNRAAALARSDYLLFLNNDIVWLHDALPALLQTLDDPAVGAVGLKLLKAVGLDDSTRPAHTSVQHLGVRYIQHHDGYWPVEVTPTDSLFENEYAPQEVPATSAAVMLCRRLDFERAGGFDEHYFYGFEDVEFCLRLRQRLQKKIICRNDLVVLHRHGHTRLTGRESGQFERVLHNASILNTQSGLWAKAAWRNSLLSADRLLCNERLSIGLVIDQPLQDGQPPPANNESVRWAKRLGYAIEQAITHARVMLVHPGLDAHDVRGLHFLVVGSGSYDIGRLKNARADLVVLAYVQGPLPAWLACPWWDSFHGYLVSTASRGRGVADLLAGDFETSSARKPLGNQVIAGLWPLRVGLDWPTSVTPTSPAQPPPPGDPAAIIAYQLQTDLKASGLAVWQLPQDRGPAGVRVIDIRICIVPHALASQPLPAAQEGTLNILWLHAALPTEASSKTDAAAPAASPSAATGWNVTYTAPAAKQLRQLWKAEIDRTFSAS